jgi:hypothetical protein
MLLLLPSFLCSTYSNLAIDDLPIILCTISSDLIQIFSATSSHNAHLLHTFCTHAIFTIVLAINDKYTSMLCLLNIFPQSPPLALMATQAPTCIRNLHLDSPPGLFSPPLTSMSKNKHAPPELLQNILPLSTMSILEIHQIFNKYSP